MDVLNITTSTTETILGFPPEAKYGYNNISDRHKFEELEVNASLMWMIGSLVASIAWVIYITFYNSRVVGYFLTKFINRLYIRGAYFKIGSLSLSPLAGKVMFRDIVFICFDYSVRIQDGYVIFRWWRSYVPKDVSEDLSHSDTRLSIMLNGFELHVYNRSELYSKLEKTFGLKPTILVPSENLSSEEMIKMKEAAMNLENDRKNSSAKKNLKNQRSEAMTAITWRDLIPVIKIDICSGRLVFGNRLTPTTLSICVEEAHCMYSTKPAVSRLDHFMHFVKAKAENAKVLLAPSPKYTGLVDDPPRYMGEGFVVMMSNLVELYYYVDEPGIVADKPVLLTLANGDVVEAAPPVWGVDVKCGKGTDFSYGPWADRQRDNLFKFFFPPDSQAMEITQPPKPGDKREFKSFDFSLSTLNEATIDILFSKNKETNAMHVTIGAGSYFELTLPWTILEDGFTTKVSGQLLHVEATTSLQYRSLAKCESLEFKIRIHYPLRWNDHQEWIINLTGCKATAYLVFAHKLFFQDLIEDWASKIRPDVLQFVPYTWKFCVLLKEFEILMLCNDYNWIDCSSTNQENNHLGFCGDLFDLSFNLPFDDFLPKTVPLRLWIHGEGLDLSLYLPEVSTTRPVVLSIDKNMKFLTRDGQVKKMADFPSKKWRKDCHRSNGWVDCWSVPIVAISIVYVYHPMPPLGPDPQADITTPEKEEILLSPIRIPKKMKSPALKWTHVDTNQFDPNTLSADKVTVEIEIGSSILFAYGTILRNFINLKENIFGEDQAFTDMSTTNSKSTALTTAQQLPKAQNSSSNREDPTKSISEASVTDEKPKRFDPRLFRPLEVTVSFTIHDIQAHIVKNCDDNDPPCPIVLVERLGLELRKKFYETEIQILVSPSFLISSDNVVRPSKEKHLKQGHLLLSALQVRGHAMFSIEGRALEEETIEYAWLLEIQLGKLSGKLTIPQLYHVVTGLETFLMLAIDAESELRPPNALRACHHGVPSNQCLHTKDENKYRCPTSEDLKYRMTRVAIDVIDIYLIESGTALHTWISPVRVSTCNLHGQKVKSGVTGLISTVLIRHFVSTNGHYSHHNGNSSYSNTNTTGSGRSAKFQQQQPGEEKKEDLNILFKKDSASVKYKRESDYGLLHRRGSRDADEHGHRRSRENDFHHRRDREEYSSMHSSSREKNRDQDLEPWLEVGCVSFGPVILEAASALPIPEHCLHLVQHNFLKTHDKRHRKIWFLWQNGVENAKCGCIGGTIFFGSNINGPKFFKPTPQDIQEGINISRYHIHSNSKEYGFGQSLLYEGQLVFHTPPYSLQPVSLEECYENIGQTNICISQYDAEPKSPLSQTNIDSIYGHSLSSNDKSDRQSKELKMKEMGSPGMLERRTRRLSSSNRQNSCSSPHDVPYSRLIDSPSNVNRVQRKPNELNRSQQSNLSRDSDGKISTPKSIRVPTPKASVSESKLSVDYYQKNDISAPGEMSHSAPQTRPLEFASNQSIDRKILSDEEINHEVQRTISLTSENPSEAFFSADEDTHTSKSMRTEVIDRVNQKKRFASEMSIGMTNDMDQRLSSHRSDYEIHTPEHRTFARRPQSTAELNNDERRIHGLATPLRKLCNVSPRPEFRHFKPVYDQAESQESSSSSPSLSSNSFISAMSSHEDITLVNLHMQVNKPIVDSPLLMASYVTHLAQVRCSNWTNCCLPYGADAFSTPLFQQTEDGGLVYIGCRLVPHFNTYSNWREVRIVSHSDSNSGPSTSSNQNSVPRSHPWDPNVTIRSAENINYTEAEDKEFMTTQNDTATRNSIVVKFRGQLEVMLTPLLLEGLQHMIEIMIPTFANMHPLTAINSMHASCIRNVEEANILKRDQSLSYWSQVHSNSKRSTAERNLQGPGGPVITDVYEESISTQIQGLVVLQRVNISLIQSSVVEEVISFSALDNVQDLSCASLLAISLDGISTRLHLGKTTRASIHTVYTQPTVRSTGMKKGRIMKGTRALLSHLSSHTRSDNIPGEPILIETSEKQQEELVITCDILKAHCQLRRLKNEGCAIQEAQSIVTAIPAHKSRAMFECVRHPDSKDGNVLGFIMFECGLEGIKTKMIKKSQFEKSENNEKNIKLDNRVTTKNDAQTSDKNNLDDGKGNDVKSKKPSTPKAPRDRQSKETDTKEKKFAFKTPDSMPSPVQEEGPTPKPQSTDGVSTSAKHSDNNGRTSSCLIDFKTVWFNFAAPPSVPITRKIDYTRLDWNLLSTASPAITAWMNPSNRFAIKFVAMMKAFHLRRTAVAASIMAESLEMQGIQKHPKTRYSGKYTPLAKTLQEDPSCQLCTVMAKFVLQESPSKIDNILKHPDLPPLNILRQGVIVLSRQWKNMLYNPMLFEHQYKNKLCRPINVTYAMSQAEEDCEDDNEIDGNEPFENTTLTNDEENERTMLLGRTGCDISQIKVLKMPESIQTKLSDSATTSPSFSTKTRKRMKKPTLPQANTSSRSSLQMFPIISGLVDKQNLEIEYGALRDGSLQSCCSSINSIDKTWTAAANPKDDLYSWMAKQHQPKKSSILKENPIVDIKPPLTPLHRSFGTSHGQQHTESSIRLLDAHLIFEPILTCLGVMPQQMVNNLANADISSLDSLGTNLSLIGSFDVMRIDIVVSESSDKKAKNRPCTRKPNGKSISSEEMPAFLCEKVGVELEVLKVTDGLTDDNKPNALYVSRGQLKKLTSTMVNFNFNVRYISQQVNMPLLRLLHQITNMYQNVKDAQDELTEQQQPSGVYRNPMTLKDESSLASEVVDPTIIESIPEPLDTALLDEHYDKFNESFNIGRSSSRTRMPTLGPLIPLTPSPGPRNRPQSFAQKLKSSSKSVKGKLGYTNLNDAAITPIKKSPTMSIDNPFRFSKTFAEAKNLNVGVLSSMTDGIHRSSSSNIIQMTSVNNNDGPQCWKTVYHLLELYATMPETKTVVQRVSISPDPTDKPNKKFNISTDSKTVQEEDEPNRATPQPPSGEVTMPAERTRLIVFGIVKIQKTRLLATLSGLKLDAEISALLCSATWRKKSRPVALECSHTGKVGRAQIVLLEGVAPNQQTVVKVTVGKSQTLFSSVSRRNKDKNNGFLSIGPVDIDIPQHPVALHGMMTRSSIQLSNTLQELRVARNSTRLSRQNEEAESPTNSKENSKEKGANVRKTTPYPTKLKSASGLIQPLVMEFQILLKSLSISAALLPSLQAQYKMDNVISRGISGYKAKFTIDLPNHTLSFTTKHHTIEANLPPEASIALPLIHVSAQYVTENAPQDIPVDGVVLRQGGYVSASAEIGDFERCLTTDLLNHLVFAQKVFMREVNEVIQKVYGGEKPVPLWLDDNEETSSSMKRILFSLNIRVKRIQLTATTPCSSAVRFETNSIEFHLSNRVKNMAERANTKLFGKAQIDFNLSLGQIIRNVIFDEAEPEFQQYAFFNTTIELRNAFQDEMNDDKELVLITLKRPLIYIQPVAVDKAILVWLNYKNAYEYWAEKRANLNKDVQSATQQVFGQFSQHLGAAANLSTLFLQLTVEDMGICLPLNQLPITNWPSRSIQDFESRGAVVITLENTNISACNSGSLVSTGKFFGLCLRFADDFETTLDDWKPNMNDTSIMNFCVVSEGTYEVCSRTTVAKNFSENAKWLLNVKWQMEGVDIHLDVNIGKQLSALGHTLTSLSNFEEDESTTIYSQDSEDGEHTEKETKDVTHRQKRALENIPAFIFDPTLDSKKRSLMMKKEMNEQWKTINDLRSLGATPNTIAHEERRFQELQAICYKYFRRDMIKKWKAPSKSIRSTNRSQSFMIASPSDEDFLVQDLYEKDNSDALSGDVELNGSGRSGPTRSASLRYRPSASNRVAFTDTMRQSSLPSGDPGNDFAEVGSLNWPDSDLSDIMDVDGERVELRKKSQIYPQKSQEPNIDFELDIKVLVNSGKCVLHTKPLNDEKINVTTGSTTAKHHKRERSIGTDWGSPIASRRNKDAKSRLRYQNQQNALLVDLTIFHIPGLDVKLHYASKIILDNSSPKLSVSDVVTFRRGGFKRASLFAWMTLQSVPEETIISPHILEFLEQTLEPIPFKSNDPLLQNNPMNMDLLQENYNYVASASFPVDVIVYFHMQPSTFRFSCLPVSRVECMLQLPSLDIVFSSKRQDDDQIPDTDKTPTGGLSITGCLADFNVFIFHPYGGKKTGLREAQFSPLADSERKDSLSINVEFVKFHLTRSRKINFETNYKKSSEQRAVVRFSTIVDIGTASFKYDMRRLTEILAFPNAWYRRRIVRRLFLGDISAKPVNPTTEGDLSTSATPADVAATTTDEINHVPLKTTSATRPGQLQFHVNNDKNLKGSKLKDSDKSSFDSSNSFSEPLQITAWETLVLFAFNFTKLNVQMNMGNVMGNVIWLTKAFRSDGRLSIGSTGRKNMHIGFGLGGSTLDAKGGIVGGTIELNKIDTHMHISEEQGVEPHHKFGLRLMALELRLDYMGTSVLMTRISSLNATLHDEWKCSTEPGQILSNGRPTIILMHGDLSWDQFQMMISKSTTADLLKMFYKLEEFFCQQFKSSKRVFINLEPRLQNRSSNSISRRQRKAAATAAAATTEQPNTSTNSTGSKEWSDAHHHRHWQKPLKKAMGLMLSTLSVPLPKTGIVLGGTIELHGRNISLACFHGINFKAKSWALFSLRDPCISFATEAKQLDKTNEVIVIQTLTFGLGLANNSMSQTHSLATVCRMTRNIVFPPQYKTLQEWFHYAFANSEIDAVERFPVSEHEREMNTNSIERARGSTSASNTNHNREVIFALPSLRLHFKTEHLQGVSTPDLAGPEKPSVQCSFITEFEDHIFVTVDADAFFFLHDLITSYLKEKEKMSIQQNIRSSSPNPTATSADGKKSDMANGSASGTNASSDAALNVENQKKNSDDLQSQLNAKNISAKLEKDDIELYLRDWRNFECKTWHLEPTVRLLSWAGKSIEPYGIDYILNKLGFSHARTTIPKWLQRGVMDPLDNVEALLIVQLLSLVKADTPNDKNEKQK